jgi:lysozyme family protein
MSDFTKAVDYTIRNEGGFTNDSKDPGGATNWGITQSDLARFRGKPVSSLDVKNLTREDAVKIYHAFYWLPLGLDALSDSDIATAIFDTGVNRGLHTAIRYSQEAAKVTIDGMNGAKTQAAINSTPKNSFLVRFATIAQHGYMELALELPGKRLGFLSGWSARAMKILTLLEGVVL